jgi:hypothetical protein
VWLRCKRLHVQQLPEREVLKHNCCTDQAAHSGCTDQAAHSGVPVYACAAVVSQQVCT